MANWGVLPQGPVQAKDKKTVQPAGQRYLRVGESESIPSVSFARDC